VNAVLLSAIKKGASAIRILTGDPMRVWFDIGDDSVEEMRPPGTLSEPIITRLCEMSGATIMSAGRFTLLIGEAEVAHAFDVTLSPGKTMMRIAPATD
jgi:hypothetical protein